jgi:pyruvyltransferase
MIWPRPRGNPGDPIPLAWFNRVPNVGDRINGPIIFGLTGKSVASADSRKPHLIAVGSLMARATPQSQVWGTGIIDPAAGVGNAHSANIHALRGKLTWAALREAGLVLRDIPLGDPAFLAPKLLGVARAAAPSWRLGVVAHYVDRDDACMKRLLADPDVCDLDVSEEPIAFLERMAACEAVASTSLHGLIFAEALGIPSVWLKAGDRLIGGAFKFLDWYSTTKLPSEAPHELKGTDTPAALAGLADRCQCEIDVAALLAVFPPRFISGELSSART